MGIAKVTTAEEGTTLGKTSIFPEFVVGKSYELKFSLGIFFSSLPDIDYPKSIEVSGVRYVFYHELRDYTNRSITIKMRLEPVSGPVQATVATPIVVGVVALVVGVVTIAMLDEVKEVVAVLPAALDASVKPLLILLGILLVGNYVYTHHIKR